MNILLNILNGFNLLPPEARDEAFDQLEKALLTAKKKAQSSGAKIGLQALYAGVQLERHLTNTPDEPGEDQLNPV